MNALKIEWRQNFERSKIRRTHIPNYKINQRSHEKASFSVHFS